MKRVLPAGVKNCPRCGENYEDFPAMSRTDNKTEVCPPCGTAEALEDFLGTGVMPQADWVKNKRKVSRFFAADVLDMKKAESLSSCDHSSWRWLDCDECRETIGVCGEKVCVSCGADVD